MAFRTAYNNGKLFAHIRIKSGSTYDRTLELANEKNPYKSAVKRKEYIDGVLDCLTVDAKYAEKETEEEQVVKVNVSTSDEKNIPHVHVLEYVDINNKLVKEEYMTTTCEEAWSHAENTTIENCTFVNVSCQQMLQGAKPKHTYVKPVEAMEEEDAPTPTYEEEFAAELREAEAVERVYGLQTSTYDDEYEGEVIPSLSCEPVENMKRDMFIISYWEGDTVKRCRDMASSEDQARKNFLVGYPTHTIIKIECLLTPYWGPLEEEIVVAIDTESPKQKEQTTMTTFDVIINDAYQGQIQARRPQDAIDTAIEKLAERGGDIRQVKKAKATYDSGYGFDKVFYYDVHMDRQGIIHYKKVG